MIKLGSGTKPMLTQGIRNVLLVLLVAVGVGCQSQQETSQAELKEFARTLGVKYQVIENGSANACVTAGIEAPCFTSRITLDLPETLPDTDWAIYFSHITPLLALTEHTFTLTHINGDLHKLTPAKSLKAGQRITLNVHGRFWQAARSDVMPNWYVDAQGLSPELLLATVDVNDPNTGVNYAAHVGNYDQPSQYQRSPEEAMPLADGAWFYTHYQQFETAQNALLMASANLPRRVIPAVTQVTGASSNSIVDVRHGLAIQEAVPESIRSLYELVGIPLSTSGMPVVFQHDATLQPAHYQLNIDMGRVVIIASDLAGRDYALLTLSQLFEDTNKQLPVVQITDGPAYDYRGMHIDIARNFPGKQVLTTLIDQMFRVKLNKLHLHLADDEAWRLALPSMSSLTEIGAKRCHDLAEDTCLLPQLGSGPFADSKANGFLTAEDYEWLLKYAQQRHIEVIPSFDMPGHSRAAIKSIAAGVKHAMESEVVANLVEPGDTTRYHSIQYYNDNTLNPCLASTYAFVEQVLADIKQLHDEAGVPLRVFHMGADETGGAWRQSPACMAKFGRELTDDDAHILLGEFVAKVKRIAGKFGLVLGGWSDGMSTLPAAQRDENTLITLWHTLASGGEKAAATWLNSKSQLVYSFPDVLYFDFPYANHPLEPGYYWASKNTDTFKVFQFTPQVLPLHQYLWTDRMGQPFTQQWVAPKSEAVGIQGQVWTEAIRTPDTLNYMLYPRVFALGERAWHKPEWLDDIEQDSLDINTIKTLQQQAYTGFAKQLVDYALPLLAKEKVNFRLPPPGLHNDHGVVTVNSLYPGLVIEYSDDGKRWTQAESGQLLEPHYQFRTRLDGTGKVSRVLTLADIQSSPSY